MEVKQPDETAAAGVPVTLVDAKGAPLATLRTNADGQLAVPSTLAAPPAAALFFAPGAGVVRAPVGEGGIVTSPTPTSPPTAIVYGQVLGPLGDGLGGIGVTLVSAGEIVAATVSDPNGAWVLSASPRDGEPLSLDFAGHASRDIALAAGQHLLGPLYVRLASVPQERAGVAPASALLTTDQRTAAEMLRRSPALWSRGKCAADYDPCSPYAPTDAVIEARRFASLVMFAGEKVSSKISALAVGPRLAAGSGALAEPQGQPAPSARLRYGMLQSIEQRWQRVGAALGDLIYSLPLAPCEQVNLAVVDWQAQQSGERVGTTAEAIQQNLAFSRNRSIDDVTNSRAQNDWQSSNVGASLSASYAGVSASVTASHGWGSQLTVTSAQSTQSLSDAIEQAAAVQRSSRMATIVQVSESESTSATTRTVRNHNHAHTLTIQYYELVERYLVSTSIADVQPVVLVPFAPIAFDGDAIDRHGEILLRRLRDPLLVDELTQWLNRYLDAGQAPASGAPPAPSPGTTDPLITTVLLQIAIPSDERSAPPTMDSVGEDHLQNSLILIFPDGQQRRFATRQVNPGGVDWTRELTLPLSPPVPLSQLAGLSLLLDPDTHAPDWDRAHYGLTLSLQHADGGMTSLPPWPDVHLGGGVTLTLLPPAPPASSAPTAPAIPSSPSQRLLAHLQANALLYTAAVLLDGDPLLLWSLLGEVETPGGAVTDICDPQVLMIQGNYLVLRMASPGSLPAELQAELPDGAWSPDSYAGAERTTVVVLPTGGMFAEAQLGHCSAAEKIDDSVFWKWQDAPCDDSAPAITDEMIKSRLADLKDLLAFASTDLSASAIETPPEPDPLSVSASFGSSGSASAPGEPRDPRDARDARDSRDSRGDSRDSRDSSSSSGSGSSSSADSSSSSSSDSGSASLASSTPPSSSAGPSVGISGNPWILDGYGVDDDRLPSAVTAETAASVFAGVGTGDVATLLAKDIVPEIGSYLATHPDAKVVVTGYTDNSGADAHNADLSTRRAKVVHDALVAAGVDGSRIEYYGAGASNPRSGFPDDSTGRNPHNRRVEIECR